MIPIVGAEGVLHMALFGFVFGLGFTVAQTLISTLMAIGKKKG